MSVNSVTSVKIFATALLIGLSPLHHSAQSATIIWNDTVSGSWSNGANWSGGIPPAATDDAVISCSGSCIISIDSDTVVKSLAINAGNVNATSSFSTDSFSMTGGTFSQVSSTLPAFTAVNFSLSGGTFIRALGGDGNSATPYRLIDIYGVQGMGSAGMLDKSYVLANDINAAGTANWNNGAGFMPVGTSAAPFSGSVDGLKHTIANLTINRPATDDVGLIGYSYNSTIRNLGLVGGSVTGRNRTGGLTGYAHGSGSGTISNTYSAGAVSGGSGVGGLVGYNTYDTISNSFNTGPVTGIDTVGGLVGSMWNSSTVNSYSTGSVTGAEFAGGLVGNAAVCRIHYSYSSGVVNSTGSTYVGGFSGRCGSDLTYGTSYWDTEASGMLNSACGSGKTTAQMKTMTTFTGWDIANLGGANKVWRVYEGHTYPLLTGYMAPLTLSDAPDVYTTYNGSLQNGASTSISGVLGAAASGTAAGVHNGYYSTQQGYNISGGNIIIRGDQSISFGAAPAIIFTGTGSVSAMATSGLPVVFGSSTPGYCSVAGDVVTGIAAGDCTITADQAGDLLTNPALRATLTFAIGRADQIISFGAAPTLVYHGTATVTASSTSGLAVSFRSTTPGICSITGSAVSSITMGDCIVAADQTGDSNYHAAPTATQTIAIAKSDQAISFAVSPVIAVGETGNVPATATSGLPVSYRSLTPIVCSISGSAVTGLTPGVCTIEATQGGDSNYNVAPATTQNVHIAKTANSAPLFAITEGRVTTRFGTNDAGTSVLVQPDGKIVVAGHSNNGIGSTDFALARYNPDGTLDSGFGVQGTVSPNFAAPRGDANSALLQSDGKIIVVGSSRISRYNTDGSLDTSYGADSTGNIIAGGTKGILQPDGKLLVTGAASYDCGYYCSYISLLRFTIDGRPDPGFGVSGVSITPIRFQWDTGTSIAVQPDGEIIVAGNTRNGFGRNSIILGRYHANGAMDTSFNHGALVSTSVANSSTGGSSVLLQADGKIVVSGGISLDNLHDGFVFAPSDYEFLLARYNSDGSLDTGFDADGLVTTDFGGRVDSSVSSVLHNGKLLSVGRSANTGHNVHSTLYALSRYNGDASPDTSFGVKGQVVTFLGIDMLRDQSGGTRSAVVQPNGKILVAGDNNASFNLVRYNADGSVDTSFGKSLYTSPVFTLGGGPVVLDTAIQVYDPELDLADNYDGTNLTLRRNGGANSEDIFTASGTLGALTPGNPLTLNGTEIGTVITNSAGTLTLGFNSAATQQLIATAMQQISYRYDYHDNAAAPLPTILIDWIFHDGNSGAQGSGGGLSATRTTEVTITGIPARVNAICGSADKTIVTLAPAANLCGDGSLPAVTGSGPWLWTCQGHYGGTPADCSAALPTLSVHVSVTGTQAFGMGGTVTSSPAGISCINSQKGITRDCNASFSGTVNLIATPAALSNFGGWSGACSGLGACSVTMSNDTTVTAAFKQAALLHVNGTEYLNLQDAYNAAATGAVIQLLQGGGSGSLTADKAITVTIRGGYEPSYTSQGNPSIVTPSLKVRQGKVVVDGVAVK